MKVQNNINKISLITCWPCIGQKMFLSLHLTFPSNSLIAFNPYGASVYNLIWQYPSNCFFFFVFFFGHLYYVEHSLTDQLFKHQSLLLKDLFLQSNVTKYFITILQDTFSFLTKDL